MRRMLFVALPLLALALTACGRKPKDGNCASDKDCSAQEGFGKICVQGRCQECAKETDCQAGFTCRDNKCAPRAECDDTRPCADGKTCQGGRCVVPPPPAAADAGAGANAGQVATPTCQLQRVNFDFNEAALRSDARDLLAKDAECMKQMKGKKVTVEGHGDERGTNEYNQHLGQRRAEAVRRYLGNLGVDVAGLDPVSYGEEQPLCSESTEDCWRQNRRVELKAQ